MELLPPAGYILIMEYEFMELLFICLQVSESRMQCMRKSHGNQEKYRRKESMKKRETDLESQ
jgi:hypothetical protein